MDTTAIVIQKFYFGIVSNNYDGRLPIGLYIKNFDNYIQVILNVNPIFSSTMLCFFP